MRHSQVSTIRWFKRSTPSVETAAETEEAVVEVVEETVEDAVVVEEAHSSRVQAPLHPLHATQGPNIQIFRLANGKAAPCISNSGGVVTFVQSQLHARGKTCLLQDQINETGTSPSTKV